MKKRKELDALLMNGKKSRPKRSKDGHELLQNMDSDTNSSDLDEFIMQPRRQTIVRRKIDICSVCLHFFAFILVVACLSATIGVGWMNVQLKNDHDELRKKLLDVELSLSNSQGSLLDETQEEALKAIPGLITTVGKLNDSLAALNKSVESLKTNLTKLEGKVVNYQKSCTDTMARKDEDLKNLGQKLENVETSVDNLKTDVASLKNQSSHEPTQSPQKVTSPTSTKTEPISDSSVALLSSVQESVQTLNSSLSKLNQNVIELAAEVNKQQGDSMPPGEASQLLLKLQQNVTYLMDVVQKELSADDDPTDAPSGASGVGGTIPPVSNMTNWQNQMENRIGTLEIEFKQFNPSDLNNNLLNNDTARGIQTVLENTYQVFRGEINDKIKAWDSNQTELANRIHQQSSLLANVTVRVDHLEFQFQNASEKFSEETKDDVSSGTTTLTPQKPTSDIPTDGPVDTGATSSSSENKVTTGGPTITEIPDTKTEEAANQADPPQTKPTPIPAEKVTEEVVSNKAVTDLENLKKTLPSSTGERPMASRSVASLTDTTEFTTGVEEMVSTNVGSTFKSTEHETTLEKKLTTTPPPPLSMPGVRGRKALQKQFHNADANRDGKLTYWEFSHLSAYRGHPPSQDKFLAHDTNHDTVLDLHEMNAAFGFSNS